MMPPEGWSAAPFPDYGTQPYWDYATNLLAKVSGPEAVVAVTPILGKAHSSGTGIVSGGWYFSLPDGTFFGAHDLVSPGGQLKVLGFYVRHDPGSATAVAVSEQLTEALKAKERETKKAQKLALKKMFEHDEAAWDMFDEFRGKAREAIRVSGETELLLTPIRITGDTTTPIKGAYLSSVGVNQNAHRQLIQSWAGSAQSADAKRLQLAAADFNGYLAQAWPGFGAQARKAYQADRPTTLRSFIAEKAWTAEVLSEIEPFVVYRGFKPGDQVTDSMKAAKQKGTVVEVTLWPLSSWTTLHSVAKGFGAGGVVVKRIVPLSRIFTAYRVAQELFENEREAILEGPLWGEPDRVTSEEIELA